MVAVASLAAWPVLTNHGKPPLLGTLGLIAMIAGVYVGLRHPQWLFWGLAAVLGGLPFGKLPAVHAPMYLVFGAGAVLAAIVHRSQRMHITRLEIAVLALFLTGFVSLADHRRELTAILEFIKWSVCTLTMLALLRLPPQLMKKFGQIFVWAAAFNSAFGILIWVADPNQKLLRIFKPFGYGAGGGLRSQLALFVYSDGGASQSLRLGGTWVLPNTAGLCIVAAMAMGFVLFVGWQRVVLTLIFLVAMGLTLSRSAIFSAVVALIIVLLLHSMRARDRQLMLGLVGLVAIAALSTPAVRDRLLMSFGSDDTGSSARKQALIDFPPMMVGKWWFGWGWGRAGIQGRLGGAAGQHARQRAAADDLPGRHLLGPGHDGGADHRLRHQLQVDAVEFVGVRVVRQHRDRPHRGGVAARQARRRHPARHHDLLRAAGLPGDDP